LEHLSVVLSQHTTAAESIVDLMCELSIKPSNSREQKSHDNKNLNEEKTSKEKNSERFSDIVHYAEQVSESSLPKNLII
jgi:hypothetical protein